jgi:hypothetical protein
MGGTNVAFAIQNVNMLGDQLYKFVGACTLLILRRRRAQARRVWGLGS